MLLSPSQDLHSLPHPAHPPRADLSQPALHRRAFSSPLQTAVTSPWKAELTLASLPAPSQPTYRPSNAFREAGPSGCRAKAPRSQPWINTAPRRLVATYIASPRVAQWETTAFLAPFRQAVHPSSSQTPASCATPKVQTCNMRGMPQLSSPAATTHLCHFPIKPHIFPSALPMN